MHTQHFTSEEIVASYYRTCIDSVKLFFANVFLYVLFLEGYSLIFLIQERFNIELPFVDLFYTWIGTFVILAAWITMALFLHRRAVPIRTLSVRAIFSELPFILLLGILWLQKPQHQYQTSVSNLLMICTAYMLLFPLVIIMAHQHSQTMTKSHH